MSRCLLAYYSPAIAGQSSNFLAQTRHGQTLKLPALDSVAVAEVRGSGYPEPFASRMGDRAKRRLGDACGLTRFGVNLVTLGPGGPVGAAPLAHARGRIRLRALRRSHAGDRRRRADAARGHVRGLSGGHAATRITSINRGDAAATYLEVGNRVDADNAFYPDDDLHVRWSRHRRALRAQGRHSPTLKSDALVAMLGTLGCVLTQTCTDQEVTTMTEMPAPEAPASEAPPSIASLISTTLLVYALFGVAAVVGARLVGLSADRAAGGYRRHRRLIVAYVKRDEAAGTWLASHLRWLIRTFWFSFLWGDRRRHLRLLFVTL